VLHLLADRPVTYGEMVAVFALIVALLVIPGRDWL
jgi:hypothetical protein